MSMFINTPSNNWQGYSMNKRGMEKVLPIDEREELVLSNHELDSESSNQKDESQEYSDNEQYDYDTVSNVSGNTSNSTVSIGRNESQ